MPTGGEGAKKCRDQPGRRTDPRTEVVQKFLTSLRDLHVEAHVVKNEARHDRGLAGDHLQGGLQVGRRGRHTRPLRGSGEGGAGGVEGGLCRRPPGQAAERGRGCPRRRRRGSYLGGQRCRPRRRDAGGRLRRLRQAGFFPADRPHRASGVLQHPPRPGGSDAPRGRHREGRPAGQEANHLLHLRAQARPATSR